MARWLVCIFRPIFIFLCLSVNGQDALQVIGVDVPPKVRSGSKISLRCLFDLQGKTLYSLNWWKDHQQFYQYSPTGSTHQIVHDTAGIDVVIQESSLKTVTLRNVTEETTGEFKCEIVADFPTYERDSLFAPLEVVDVPNGPPVIGIGHIHYRVGDIMEANCTSPGSIPPPVLLWYINGKEIPARNIRIHSLKSTTGMENTTWNKWRSSYTNHSDSGNAYPVTSTADPVTITTDPVTSTADPVTITTDPVTSTVFLMMKQVHFMREGRATLSCLAFIQDIYSSATTVQLTLPGIKPAAPSQRVSNSPKYPPIFSNGFLFHLVSFFFAVNSQLCFTFSNYIFIS